MSRLYIFDALRSHLKTRGISYSELAFGLNVAEGTIKRIFTKNDCSTERLDEIAQYLDIHLVDLFQKAPPSKHLIDQLSYECEEQLARNKKLLMLAICVMDFWPFKDMLKHLTVGRDECIALLKELERMGFIEMNEKYNYRLLLTRNFSWLRNGPITQLVKSMSQDYFDHPFDAPGDFLKIVHVRVSPYVRNVLKGKFEEVLQHYIDQVALDAHLPLDERPPLSICVAVRSWVPDFLHELMQMDVDEDNISPHEALTRISRKKRS
jgi:transcriptional regulator with XRE-family HTH domain